MPQYVPHGVSLVQSIFKQSRNAYDNYANPSVDILERVDQYIGCADWLKGVARIQCKDCGDSYFRPFSCKTFHLCPSCDQKRTLLYVEFLVENLLLDLPHQQFAHFHPYWHVLVLEGGFTDHDRFVYLPLGADDGLLKVWRDVMLNLFLKMSFIDQARADMIRSWIHSCFSIESENTQSWTTATIANAVQPHFIRRLTTLQ